MAGALETPLFIFVTDDITDVDLLYAPGDAWGYYEWPDIESGLYIAYDNADRRLTFTTRVEIERCFFGLFECEVECLELVADEDQTRASERFRYHLLRSLRAIAKLRGAEVDEQDLLSPTLEELKALAIEKARTDGWCSILV